VECPQAGEAVERITEALDVRVALSLGMSIRAFLLASPARPTWCPRWKSSRRHAKARGNEMNSQDGTPRRAPREETDDTVGSFFNFLPLRADLAGCRDASDLLRRPAPPA
jgi:hypothetical protein